VTSNSLYTTVLRFRSQNIFNVRSNTDCSLLRLVGEIQQKIKLTNKN